jgi:DNA-binding Lrp family transcriptional regulator
MLGRLLSAAQTPDDEESVLIHVAHEGKGEGQTGNRFLSYLAMSDSTSAPAPSALAVHTLRAQVVASPAVLRRAALSKLERDIVEVLQKDGRRPFAQIAREVGAAEKTVRNAVARLEETNAIDITAVTFPDLLGYSGAATCGITVGPGFDVRSVARQLGEVDVINYVAATAGSFHIFADVVCRDKQSLLAALDDRVRSIPGVVSIETFLYLNVTYRSFGFTELAPHTSTGKPPIKLTEMDRRIFSELSSNGRASYHAIGKKLGVSESLVRQRVKRATDAGVLSINALVNPASLGADVMAWIGIRSRRAMAMELARTLADWPTASYVAVTAGRFDVFVELACESEPELIEQLQALSALELVETAEPFVYLDLQVKALVLVEGPSFGEPS